MATTREQDITDAVDDEKGVNFDWATKLNPIATATSLSFPEYEFLYRRSIDQPEQFWSEMSRKFITWFQPFSKVLQGSLVDGSTAWFLDGKVNACYNCVDRHVEAGRGSKVALIYEGNEPSDTAQVTYQELQAKVCQLANALTRRGVKAGDTVCIYMNMVPHAVYSILACARIGAVHSVVFAGFSSDALADRILDANCKVVITSNEALRGPKHIPIKSIVDEALLRCSTVETCFVLANTPTTVSMKQGRDLDLHQAAERPYCPCAWMDSESPLFLLYTSGSTGKPKGLMHTTGGYLTYAAMTHKFVFDVRDNDVYACMADVGWITGHSYIVYGPLTNGSTTFLFEGLPTYPDAGRYWDMVQRHRITLFYTAPTAIRTLMKSGEGYVTKYDRSSLRVLGTVGEPINPAAWQWYFSVVGDGKCSVVDTYWQTETGGHILTPLPGCTPLKPGSCALPFFGIVPNILDPHTGQVVPFQHGVSSRGVLVLSRPWPGMARTINGDHERYLSTYLSQYQHHYFTGDGAYRDPEGFFWIIGRVDDVMNVSGHRLGTAEIESSLVAHHSCNEAAVVPIPHDVKGQGIVGFVTLKDGYEPSAELVQELKGQVRHVISPIATPDKLFIVPGLPKTRSGKIMRRILRKIAEGNSSELGDISTLADPAVVHSIIQIVAGY